jgi:uncharacterized protein DUF3800
VKVMFLDESGDHKLTRIYHRYPIFVLGGAIVERAYVRDVIEPEMNQFKRRYFGRDDVVLHTVNMRNGTGDYAFLADPNIRSNFSLDLNSPPAAMGIQDCRLRDQIGSIPGPLRESGRSLHVQSGYPRRALLLGTRYRTGWRIHLRGKARRSSRSRRDARLGNASHHRHGVCLSDSDRLSNCRHGFARQEAEPGRTATRGFGRYADRTLRHGSGAETV